MKVKLGFLFAVLFVSVSTLAFAGAAARANGGTSTPSPSPKIEVVEQVKIFYSTGVFGSLSGFTPEQVVSTQMSQVETRVNAWFRGKAGLNVVDRKVSVAVAGAPAVALESGGRFKEQISEYSITVIITIFYRE